MKTILAVGKKSRLWLVVLLVAMVMNGCGMFGGNTKKRCLPCSSRSYSMGQPSIDLSNQSTG